MFVSEFLVALLTSGLSTVLANGSLMKFSYHIGDSSPITYFGPPVFYYLPYPFWVLMLLDNVKTCDELLEATPLSFDFRGVTEI